MRLGVEAKWAVAAAVILAAASSTARADDDSVAAEISAALEAQRIADLEAKQNSNWLNDEHTAQIKQIVADVLKDAKTRTQFADGPSFGYDPNNGFYIQDASENNKLYVSGYMQIRYEGAQFNAYNDRTLPSRTVGTGTGSTFTPSDPGNSSGIDVRRARVSFAGNVFTPDLTFKLEGDFYGSTDWGVHGDRRLSGVPIHRSIQGEGGIV